MKISVEKFSFLMIMFLIFISNRTVLELKLQECLMEILFRHMTLAFPLSPELKLNIARYEAQKLQVQTFVELNTNKVYSLISIVKNYMFFLF